jgi:lysophospholipase L1-like esterase
MKKFLLAILFVCLPAYAGVYVYGDSIPACTTGVSLPANCMVSRLNVDLGVTATNSAVSGSQAADQAVVAKNHAPIAGDQFVVYVGTNDANLYLGDPTKQGYYRAALEYLLVWNATPTKTNATAGTLTAGWFADAYSSGVGEASFTPGDTATFTVSGTTVYIAMKYYTGGYGTANILVDGVVKATYTATDTAAYTTGLNAAPYDQVGLIRIPGLAAGSHSVQIAVTAGTGTYPPIVYLQWVAGSSQAAYTPVYVNTIHHWATYAGANTAANIDAYNAIQNSVIAELQADGLNIVSVNPNLIASDISSDGIHPNDTGDGKIAAADFAAMSGPPPPYYPAYLCTNGTGYFGAKDMGCTINLQPL